MGMYTPTSMDSQVCNYCSYRQNNMSEVLSEDVRSRIYTLFLLENTFKKNFMAPFLCMGFNCLKARATSRRQFTFYH